MRGFYFANNKEGVQAYPEAQLPEYQTKQAAGADFFAAETVIIPSIWTGVFNAIGNRLSNMASALFGNATEPDNTAFKPTLVHTGIKAQMEEDEVLELYNRSSNPFKLGLILANSVGVIDGDYYNNPDNDGEIMFAFFNFMPYSVTIEKGSRIGQGVFKKFLRPTEGLRVKDNDRDGGFGSTGNETTETIKTTETNTVSLEKETENVNEPQKNEENLNKLGNINL